MKNIIKPTVDCDTCNQDGVDKSGNFYCNWRLHKKIKVVEGGRCWHVLLINATYDKCVKQGELAEAEMELKRVSAIK